MSPRFIAFCALFAPIFGFSIYLLACTASIYPGYQQDIGRIRWFSPFLILTLSFVIAVFLAQQRHAIVRFLQLALAICAVVFVIVLAGHSRDSLTPPQPPAERTLRSTVSFALAHPDFSNRSFAAPLYSAVLTVMLWLIHGARTKSYERSS